jgi:hypothetical protein
VGIVDDQPCVVRPTRASERIKWPHITIHAKHAIRRDNRCDFRMFRQSRLGGCGIRMRVSLEARAGQHPAIYQRRMTQPVEQYSLAAPGKRSDHCEVRHVTSGKQQCTLTPRKRGKLFLQASMFGTVPGNQVRSPATGTAAFSAFAHGSSESRMPCQTQIIVAGEVDELPPINNRSYPAATLDEPSNRSPLAT